MTNTSDPEDLGAGLAALLDEPAPPHHISIDEICNDGFRLRQRRRRTGTALSATAVAW